MDEPELPPLPQSTAALPRFTRKRTHNEYEINTSSDPALFSSDDYKEASADVYVSKRRKEKWSGTWWGDRLRKTSPRRKRSFKRNYDSGIFMGSEGTDSSFDEEILADHRALEDKAASVPALSPDSERYSLSITPKIPTFSAQSRLVASTRDQAVAIIQKCLEVGSENVDLSSLYLETLPSEVSLLKSLTKHNRISDRPATQEGYSSIEAKLRLYLANNSLRNVPSFILELENLRLLSLRQNNITQIPAGIRKLVHLKVLNVAGNDLKCLPFEIIELFMKHSLVELVADRNPWEEWLSGQDESFDEVSLTNQKESLADRPYVAKLHTGDPILFRANGTPRSESKAFSAAASSKSRVPHLTELVLRRLRKLPELSSIDGAIIEDLPETAQHMITEAQDAQSAGGRQCTKCHTDIVIPHSQWLEWWSVGAGPVAFLVPFLRQQCHELCEGEADTRTKEHSLR